MFRTGSNKMKFIRAVTYMDAQRFCPGTESCVTGLKLCCGRSIQNCHFIIGTGISTLPTFLMEADKLLISSIRNLWATLMEVLMKVQLVNHYYRQASIC